MDFLQNKKIKKNRFLGSDFLPLQNAEAVTLIDFKNKTSLKNTRASLSAQFPEETQLRRFCGTVWILCKRVTLTFLYTGFFYCLQVASEDIVLQALQQSHLMIQEIDLQNNLLVSKEEVLKTIKIRSAENWLLCDLKKIREAVETIPNVKSAVVQKIFPGILRICLEERNPVFCMRVGGELLDAEGKVVLLKNGFQRYPDLPRLSGISLSDYYRAAGTGMIASDTQSMYQMQVTLLNAFQKYFEKSIGIVSEVSVLPYSTELHLKDGLILRFPNQQPLSLFPRLSKVWEDLCGKNNKTGKIVKTIDMQFKDVFVTTACVTAG